MKIFAVIRNYGQPVAESPMGEGDVNWYEMPDSSVLRSGNPFFVPDFDSEFQLFPSICYRIGRLGKSISRRFAHRYIDAATISAAIVATPLLGKLREDGLPWTRAVSFDRSCLLGNLEPINSFIDCEPLTVECGEHSLKYDLNSLRQSIDSLIETISADNTLKNGDLILAGLTAQGITLKPGMNFHAIKNDLNKKLIDINIK